MPWTLGRAQRAVRAIRRRVIRATALAYRVLLLSRVTFIGVTGSTGKTTTKELIAAILSSRFRGTKSPASKNIAVRSHMYQVRPWHEYHVQEIAAAIRGRRIGLEKPLALVRPRIGVVTNIGTDHISAFGSMDATAAEKGKLIASLPRSGTAILNADDPRVLAMQARCRCRVITYGLSQHATIRAENIRCTWPERLSFDVVHDGRHLAVRTRLCGEHWVSCVLAALGAALAMGVPLADAVRAIETAMPVEGRMQPETRADRVTFIRDDMKTPLWSTGPAFAFMASARATRKIIVVGTISDYAGKSDTAHAKVARAALDAADLVLFVGPKASKCLGARAHPKGDSLRAFLSVESACEYLGGVLRAGDLVLLKGQNADALGRLCSAEARGGRSLRPREPLPCREGRAQPQDTPCAERAEAPVLVVVGLGNPREEHRDTPHNVGQRVVDQLARSMDVEWGQRQEALVATAERQNTRLYLVKPTVYVNGTGPVLLDLSREIGFEPDECVLVQDDIDLPLGTSRVRLRGSDGGHRGVRSVLEAFGTDSIARVKIGVGRPERRDKAAEHVVRPFSADEQTAVAAACARAADRVLEMVSHGSPKVNQPAGRSSVAPARPKATGSVLASRSAGTGTPRLI